MRSIPDDIIAKLQSLRQTKAKNADPGIKAYLSKGFVNELFLVYTIQEGENLEAVDVTVKRLLTSETPEEAFAICLDNGIASIKSKPLPYDETYPWVSEFQVATGVSEAAIEMDGFWEFNLDERRYNFVTDEYPWIFYVVSGVLKAQYWQNAPIDLATDVVKISSVRGWVPANGDQTIDQGLIICYTKTDGLVYYRNYCIQDSLKSWGTEKQITDFTGNIQNLSLFRTNDYRIGVAVEYSDGSMKYVITDRNWAGMGFPAEIIRNDLIVTSTIFTLYELSRLYNTMPSEVIEINISDFGILNIYEGSDSTAIPELSLKSAYIVDNRHYYIQFSHLFYIWDESSLINSVSKYKIESAYIDGDKIYYTLAEDIIEDELVLGFSVIFGGGIIVHAIDEQHQELFNGGTITVQGIIPPIIETINIGLTKNSSFTIYIVEYSSYNNPEESIIFGLSVTSSAFAITEASINPV